MPTANHIVTFFRHLRFRIRKYLNDKIHDHSLFKDDIWKIRFSRARHHSYTNRKSSFSLSLKSADDFFKYLFFVMMMAMLVIMPVMSEEVGVSAREIEQNRYTESVYNHLHDIGDTEAYKSHPFARSQAQYIDLLVFSVCRHLGFGDIYLIKHLASSVFGWLIILYLSILVVRAFSWRAAFITAFFLFISPRFVGYSLSNLSDVTFTFGMVFTITQMYYFSRELPAVSIYRIVKIVIGTLVALSCYNAGFVLLHFLAVFTLLNFLLHNPAGRFFSRPYLRCLGILCLLIICATATVYAVHGACTPFLERSAERPGRAFTLLAAGAAPPRPQLFGNRIITPGDFPRSYFAKYLFITTPTVVLAGFLLFFIFIRTAFKSLRPYSVFIFLYAFFYCTVKIRPHYMNPDTLWAIHFIVYPLFILIAACGMESALRCIDDRYTNSVIFCIIGLLSFMPVRHIVQNHPLTTMYFNELSGGIHNTYDKYELNSNTPCNKAACLWIVKYIRSNDVRSGVPPQGIGIATNGNSACRAYIEKGCRNAVVRFQDYQPQDSTWDYYMAFYHGGKSAGAGPWPPDGTFHSICLEKIPVVAFIRNEKRWKEALLQDSIRKAGPAEDGSPENDVTLQ